MRVVVGRVGRAHGIRGEVLVEVRTDEPETRFVQGASLLVADDRPPGRLAVVDARWHSGRLLVRFDGVTDRSGAEGLRGLLLEADVDPAATPDEPDTYYDRQLVGLDAIDLSGTPLGPVVEVVHLPGQDLLAVDAGGDEPVLVPFVSAIVPAVDLAGGRVVLTPPAGLFDPPDPPGSPVVLDPGPAADPAGNADAGPGGSP